MSPQRYEHLLKIVVSIIVEKGKKFRKVILPEQRLVIILRFLSFGESQQSLSYNYRVRKSTV